MTGLTPIQAERLHTMRIRRTRVRGEVEALQQCETRMISIRERSEKHASNFRLKSRINSLDWRGKTSTQYNENCEQSKATAQSCIKQMNNAIQQLSQRRSALSTEIVNLNASIEELERIERGGI